MALMQAGALPGSMTASQVRRRHARATRAAQAARAAAQARARKTPARRQRTRRRSCCAAPRATLSLSCACA
jgi:hypothetical protein